MAVYPASVCDTVLEIYTDQNLTNRIYINDDFNGLTFSRVEAQFTRNTSYYIKLRTFQTTHNLRTRIFIRDVSMATQSWHWVNSNKRVAWAGRTVYNNELNSAISKLNNYKPQLIQPSIGTETKITNIIDRHIDSGWAGLATSNGEIVLSTIVMPTLNNNQRTNIIAHEFGHILGMEHNEVYDLMWSAAANYLSSWSLSRNDKKTIDYLLNVY